ncbi:MAG TPA: glycosyltransferase family 39 protein [Bacteroidia bacterium]|nr:glycosyltransferase family 39 protein [Bacteroidia bacterium]
MNKIFHSKPFFVSALILIHALFFVYAFRSGNIYLHNDSDEYLHQAENLKQHHSWYAGDWNKPVNNYLVSRRPPLSGFLIMVIKSICHSDFAVCVIQCLLSIINLLIVVSLIRKYAPQWNKYGNIIFLLLFFPTQFIYANMIMAEVFFQTMLLLAFYFIVKYFDSKKSIQLLWFHFFLTAAVLIKPVLYLFWIPLLLFMLWLSGKKLIKPFHLSFALIFISAIFFISFHNYKKTGYFHYSSVNENYIVNYSVYLTVADKAKGVEAESKISDMMTEAKSKVNYHDYSVFIRNESFQIIKEHLSSFIFLQTKGILNFFIDHGRWDIYAFFDKQPEENMKGWKYYYQQEGIKGAFNYLKQFNVFLFIYLVLVYLVNAIITAAFVLFLFNKEINPALRMIIFLLIAYLAIITGMIGSARFRMAVYPFLLFTFPFGFEKLKSLIQREKRKEK